MNTSKVIRGEDSSDCLPWQAPEVAASASASSLPPTAARIEEIQRQAYEEAFELGRREGIEKGREQARAQAERLQSIMDLLGAPLRELDERVVDDVVGLALAIARHLVRREVKADPGQIVAVVRQATEVLPVSARHVRIVLHPEDAAIVREALNLAPSSPSSGLADGGGAWKIVEDPAMLRGGCRVETEHSRIDASIEKRLAAIAADLLGGERGQDDGRGTD